MVVCVLNMFYMSCFLAIKFALVYKYIKVVYGYPVVLFFFGSDDSLYYTHNILKGKG